MGRATDMARVLVLLTCLLAASACVCRPTWLRSCGPAYAFDYDWRIDARAGSLVVLVRDIPAGTYEIEARTSDGLVLGRETIDVVGNEAPQTVIIRLDVARDDVFPVIRRKGPPHA